VDSARGMYTFEHDCIRSNQSAVTYYIIPAYASHTFKQTKYKCLDLQAAWYECKLSRYASVLIQCHVLWSVHYVCVFEVHLCGHTLPSSVQTIVILNSIP